MGGQTGTQQQQTQQTTQLPPWINDAAQQNYGVAQGIAARPLQQYQGQMTPDISDQLQQSWNTAATAGNAGVPQFNAATAGFAGALGQTPMTVTPQSLAKTSLQPYMDPFTQDVINTSLPIMQQQLGQTLATNAGNAVNQGAFGGSRFGVQQGTAQAQGALGMANMAAGLNQANFTQAQAAATGDISRDLTAKQGNQTAQQAKINSDIAASQGLNTTGQNLGQNAQNAFTMQNTAGTQQMANAQDQINAQMQKFQQAWGYPTQQLGVMQSALGMTPYGQSTTGASDTTTYTPTDWAALAGAGIGALGNIFGGKASDKRLKKNLQKLGVHGPSKTPIYAFNWKGEPPSAPKSLGPMAQDLKKTIPGSVMKHPATGMLHVHPAVHGALSAPAPAGTIGAMAMGKPTPLMHTQHRRRVRPPQIRGALSA
jgi:Chaperone of endosialidase